MALDATLGSATANSYVTRAEALVYFEDRGHASAWALLTGEEQDQHCITASRMLDWFIKWKGTKATVLQAMLWPREDAVRPDGTEIEDDELPPEIKIAVYEQAFSSITADRTDEDPLAGIGQLRAGSLMIKSGPEKPNQTNSKPVPSYVYNIVSDLYNSGGTVRLLRA